MRFTIVTNKKDHQPPQSCCDFQPPGGTIGRGVDNNLVLPDEERAISRLQAIVHITAQGECRLTNRGNVTRVLLNDIPLERGRQVELQDGDIIGIDDYRLQINDLSRQPLANQAPQPSPASSPPSPPPSPLKEQASTSAIPGAFWDDLAQEFSLPNGFTRTPQAVVANPAPNPLAEAGEIGRNPLDPLSLLAPANLMPTSEARPPSADTLFSDQGLFTHSSLFADPTPSALLQKPDQHIAFQPAKPPSAQEDPLALFGAGAIGNQDPLGLITTQPPEAITTQAAEAALNRAECEVIALPTPQTVVRQIAPAPKGRLRIDPVASATPSPSSAAESQETLQGELLQALINGMGLTDLQPTPRFEPQNMAQLGQMLSMFSQGTVALLSSRSILKRGVKAEMTVILDEANNPFKLLPSGKTVLMQMFGSRMPGFMAPTQSVRDALVDLQAHQLGMIAGIRAIIAAMLQSFNPAELEEQARQEGVTSRLLLPRSRKAALWDQFNRRYRQTAGEIEDDFHTLFGEAFLHAYDMEINQYKDSQSRAEQP